VVWYWTLLGFASEGNLMGKSAVPWGGGDFGPKSTTQQVSSFYVVILGMWQLISYQYMQSS